LEYVRDELYIAEENNQSVIIIGHIPPGDCDPGWVGRYNALVDRFSYLIRGQFFGHTHVDEFEITRSYIDNAPIGVVFVDPSVTTRSYLNPSFRIFDFDTDTNIPTNYYQYRLNFTKWNSNITGPIEWDLAYDFLSEYNLPDLSPESYLKLANSFFEPDQANLETYILNKQSGYGTYTKQNPSSVQHNYCNVATAVSSEYFKCLGIFTTFGDAKSYAEGYEFGFWYTVKEQASDLITN